MRNRRNNRRSDKRVQADGTVLKIRVCGENIVVGVRKAGVEGT